MLQLKVEHLLPGLPKQNVVGFGFAKDLEKQPGTGLQVPVFFCLSGVSLKHQASNARNVAEPAAGQLGGVEPRFDVGQQAPGRKELLLLNPSGRNIGVAQHLKAVIVHRNGEGNGEEAGNAVGQDLGHAFVHEAALEREEKQVVALARPKLFHQKTALARQGAQSLLNFQQGLQS